MMLYIIYRWTSCIYPEKEHKIPLLVYFAFFRCQCSIGTDFFNLLYTHLEERECNNVCQNLKQDEEYPEAPQEEIRLCSRFESHALTEEHYFFKRYFKYQVCYWNGLWGVCYFVWNVWRGGNVFLREWSYFKDGTYLPKNNNEYITFKQRVKDLHMNHLLLYRDYIQKIIIILGLEKTIC